MAGRLDDATRRLLRTAFADPASNVPAFTWTAETGGYRRDEGLEHLLGPRLSLYRKKCLVKEAIVRFLDRGREPNVETSHGDAQMQIDPARYFHFRVVVKGQRLFVKVSVEGQAGHDPEVVVISVKRADR